MRPHRLQRLTRLSQGVALIGLGLAELACATEPAHVNGPAPHDDGARRATPTSTAAIAPPQSAPVDAGAAVDPTPQPTAATLPPRPPSYTNSMPRQRPAPAVPKP